MKKIISIIAAIICFATQTNSQITKGNWIVGGNASFSTDQNSLTNRKATNISFKPNIGYFILDKLPVGFKIDYAYQGFNINGATSHSLMIGPFGRYYFLKTENTVNFFVELNYEYGTYKITGVFPINDGRIDKYSFLLGSSIYFNSSVGLEFSVGYYNSKDITQNIRDSGLQMGIGFQIHLEK